MPCVDIILTSPTPAIIAGKTNVGGVASQNYWKPSEEKKQLLPNEYGVLGGIARRVVRRCYNKITPDHHWSIFLNAERVFH